MNLEDFLNNVSFISKKHGLSEPYIVGGSPRDKLLNKLDSLSDIDLTTGNDDIFVLAREVGLFYSKYLKYFKVMNDKHASLKIGNIKVDFSNHFTIPNIKYYLEKNNINSNDMLQEIYSRDFTCNTLLWSLDLKKIFDLTNNGINDIKNKIIKTCLEPEITFKSDPKRIIRIVYLYSKLGFSIENNTKNWIKNNSHVLRLVNPDYITKKTIKAIKYNKNATVEIIKDLNLKNYIPSSSQELIPYFNEIL